jgi:hemoglobin
VIARTPVHPSITEAQIDALVETFYSAIWSDDRLGPIFSAHITDRPVHLATMKRFWSSVLLHTSTYKGRPVPAHAKLTGVVESDFPRWLDHFHYAAQNVFEPDAAVLVDAAAKRIAESL